MRDRAIVGRADVLAGLEALLDAGERLITLVGPPGVGKTRLARELAARREASTFCDLSRARDEAGFAAAVSEVVGAPSSELSPAFAAHRAGLIVLDNFEQLPPPCARSVGEWVEAAPRLAFLITSRTELRLAAERVVPITPLSENHAVELFLNAATVGGWEGARTASATSADVRAIVQRLEGLPLALVLAASRVRAIGVARMREALERSLDALGAAPIDAAPHHATMRHAIEGSLSLLAEDDRRLLAYAACFDGAFELDDLAAVAEASAGDVLGPLERLVGASLVSAQHDGAEIWYRVHAVIREIAGEDLGGASRARALDRLAHTMAAAARRLSTDMSTRALLAIGRAEPDLRAAFDRLLPDSSDRDALAQPAGATTAACEIACALGRLIDRRGPTRELVTRLARAAEMAERSGENAGLRGRVAWMLAYARFEAGALDDAARGFRDALRLARDAGDALTETIALAQLATVALRGREDDPDGRDDLEVLLADADRAARRTGDAWAEGLALGVRGIAAFQRDDRATARATFARARGLHRQAGDRLLEGVALGILGNMAQDEGDLDEARAMFAEAIDAFVALGARSSEGIFRGYLASVLEERRDLDRALAEQTEATTTLAECRARRFEARFRAARAALLARAGAGKEARQEIENAHALCAEGDHAELATSVALHAARVSLACIAAAGASSDRVTREVARACAALDAVSPELLRASDDVRFARRMLDREIDQAVRETRATIGAWRIVRGGGAIRHGKTAIDLTSRKPLRAILWALTLARLVDTGTPVSADALIAAGWPEERVRPDAAAHRLRVAISTLRKLGLRELLETMGDAYRLSPEAPIELDARFDPV